MECKNNRHTALTRKVSNILCIGMAAVILLTGCSSRMQQYEEPVATQLQCTYRLDFSLVCEPENAIGEWGVVYSCFDEKIKDGHLIQFPEGVFSFHTVKVDLIEKDHPRNSYSTELRVGILRGGSGSTEVTVTNRKGENALFHICCNVI